VLSPELLAPQAVLLRAVQASLLWLAVFTIGVSPMLRSDPTVLAKDRYAPPHPGPETRARWGRLAIDVAPAPPTHSCVSGAGQALSHAGAETGGTHCSPLAGPPLTTATVTGLWPTPGGWAGRPPLDETLHHASARPTRRPTMTHPNRDRAR